MRASFYNSADEGVAAFIIGLFYGDVEELKEILEPLLVLPRAEADFEYTTFLNAIKKIGAIYPTSEKFKSTGRFADRIYSKHELLKLASSLQEKPIGSVYAAVSFYGLGRAVKDKGKHETAFFCGGALGSWLGTFFWGLFGWIGVCGIGITFQIIAATIHIWGVKRR